MSILRFPFKNNDPARSFENLIQPHLYHMYQLAYRLCNNQSDAEDLVQDVVLKLLPRHEEMQQIEKLRPWLARVLYRHFVDTYRQQSRSPLSQLRDESGDVDLMPAQSAQNPEKHAEGDMLGKHLSTALQTLNEDQRIVVMMHDVEGYTLKELELILETPEGTLKSRLNRARTSLKQVLQKDYGQPDGTISGE